MLIKAESWQKRGRIVAEACRSVAGGGIVAESSLKRSRIAAASEPKVASFEPEQPAFKGMETKAAKNDTARNAVEFVEREENAERRRVDGQAHILASARACVQ